MNLKTIKIDLSKYPFNREVIKMINSSKKIYLIPLESYNDLLNFVKERDEFNNYKFWKEILEILSFLIRSDNNNHSELHNIAHNGYVKHIETLYNLDIINGRDSYEVGIKSFNYNINLDSQKYVYISLEENDNEDEIYYKINDNVNINDNYKNTLLNADIYLEQAIFAEYNFLLEEDGRINPNRFLKRINNIFNFKYYRSIKKGNKVDRLYSSFTFLSNVARKYVHIDGKTFNSIDLKNCQPLLLSLYLQEYYVIDENYINDCKNGVFYESIMNKAKELDIINQKYEDKYYNFDNRKEVKTLVYQSLFFYQNYNSHIWNIFNELYPMTAYNLQREVSLIDSLAKILQNYEANIFLNIEPNCSYFTVHDAIYFNDINEKEFIEKRIKELIIEDQYMLDFSEAIKINYDIDIQEEGDTKIFIINEKTTRKKHKKHSLSNDTIEKIEKIKYYLDKGLKQKDICEILKCSKASISLLIKKHLK